MTAYLLGALGLSIVINIMMFLVAFRFQTDRFTDISYSLTFIVLAIYGLLSCHPTRFHLLIIAMVSLWAVRLGGFLLYRVWRKKKDSRFDEMRHSFWKFGRFWLLQGLAVWVILLPSLMALHIHVSGHGYLVVVGFLIWLSGLGVETVADFQKYIFSTNIKNKGHWIESGLWKYSRHPNYLGEIRVWIGLYLVTFETLTIKGRIVGLISPLFIFILLVFVSGIPILEKSADHKWGKLKAYQAYIKRTSVLLLLPNKK